MENPNNPSSLFDPVRSDIYTFVFVNNFTDSCETTFLQFSQQIKKTTKKTLQFHHL